MKRKFQLAAVIFFVLLLAACSSSESEVPLTGSADPEISAESTPIALEDEMAGGSDDMTAGSDDPSVESDEMMTESDDLKAETEESGPETVEDEDLPMDSTMDDQMTEEELERPAWQKSELINARTGETFTLAEFAGKTVFVEPMATWCTNCRRQLTNVQSASGQFSSEDVVFIALSVETNISDEELARYADNAGFNWLFAVMTPEIVRQMADEFGQAVTNPPATPHFIIRPDGTFTELTTGIEPAEQIVSQIRAAQS